jgi:putative ABC transport system permease protein
MKLLRMSAITALRALARSKLRAALTILGIVIGVSAVITTVGIAQGAARAVQNEISSLGRNLLVVMPGSQRGPGGAHSGWGGFATLSVDDARAVAREVPGAQDVAHLRGRRVQVLYGNANWSTTVQGSTPSYARISGFELQHGSFFDERDAASAARVVVLGATVAKQLFRIGEDPLGAVVRIESVPFRVVGVLASKGQATFGPDRDDLVVVPFAAAERRLLGSQIVGLVSTILVSAETAERIDETREEIAALLRQRHGIAPDEDDDFSIRSQEDVASMARTTMGIMSAVLLSVASISLLVGGIGIMNILFVSVTERTREIGIRMAVGAKRRHILMQFLAESTILSALGGLVGTLLGTAAARLIAGFAGWPFVVSPLAILGAVLFSASVGIFFGFYPARQAARLDPIASLRYE